MDCSIYDENILRWVFLSIIGLLNQLIIDAAIAGIWFSDWQKEK